MRTVTESYTVVNNEDGSRTTTEVSTVYPTSNVAKLATAAALGVLVALPYVPAVYSASYNAMQKRLEARRTAKLQK